jgi:hypothetical protein
MVSADFPWSVVSTSSSSRMANVNRSIIGCFGMLMRSSVLSIRALTLPSPVSEPVMNETKSARNREESKFSGMNAASWS